MSSTLTSTENGAETDRQLWAAATERGDQSAFAALYQRHRPMALKIARGICGSDAEDAVQSAFLAIWASRDGFDTSKGSLRSWMLTIVRNRSIDVVRTPRWRRETVSEFTELDLVEPSETDEIVAARETEGAVREAVASLPQSQRTVVTLGYFDELSQSEIASRLNLPLGTVKGRARAALKNLRPVAAAA